MPHKILILDNKKCQVITDDQVLIKKLHKFLSFKLTGVEYTPAYQNGWNGITYLLSKTNKFNFGLLTKVQNFLFDNNYSFEIEDKRISKTINSTLDISENLKKHNLIPREHQLKILALTDSFDRGIIRAATASGKSLSTALITAKLNKPTIIYVIGLDLLDQFHKLYSKLFDEKIGYIGNGVCDPARITIASIWTIGRALSIKNIIDEDSDEKELSEDNYHKIIKLLNEAKVHQLDESHVCTTSTLETIYKHIDPEYFYGFSGTPFRDDNSDLLINGLLGEQIIDISASELIAKGLLAQPLIKFLTVPKMSNVGTQYLAVYKNYIVENDYRNNLIVSQTQSLLDKKYTPLVLFKQIKHGQILFEKMTNAGIKCEMLYGNDNLEMRNEIKQKLVNKEIDVILASNIFDIGLDLPELNALVLSGGGKSSIRALQRIGRVIRMTPNKKFAAIVDFYDQAKFLKNHSLKRYKIYQGEPGFKVFKSPEMK